MGWDAEKIGNAYGGLLAAVIASCSLFEFELHK